MQSMLWLVKRHGSFLDPTTVSNCTKCAKFFCPTMLLFLSSWVKLMSRRHSLLIIFRGWWWWYGSEFSQSSFNSIVLSVSVVKQCCFKSCYCFEFKPDPREIFASRIIDEIYYLSANVWKRCFKGATNRSVKLVLRFWRLFQIYIQVGSTPAVFLRPRTI